MIKYISILPIIIIKSIKTYFEFNSINRKLKAMGKCNIPYLNTVIKSLNKSQKIKFYSSLSNNAFRGISLYDSVELALKELNDD